MDLDGSTEQIARSEVERFRQPLLLTKAGTPDRALAACRDIFRLFEAYNAFLAHSEKQVLLTSFEAPERRMSKQSFDTTAFQQMSRTLNFRIWPSPSSFSRSGAFGMVGSCFDWKARTQCTTFSRSKETSGALLY